MYLVDISTTSVWYCKYIRQDVKIYPRTGGKSTPKTLLRRYDYALFCANVVSLGTLEIGILRLKSLNNPRALTAEERQEMIRNSR
jgi:hypothetical protein